MKWDALRGRPAEANNLLKAAMHEVKQGELSVRAMSRKEQ